VEGTRHCFRQRITRLSFSGSCDYLQEILAVIATEIDSLGREPELDKDKSVDRGWLDEAAARRAAMELNSRFELEQIIRKYDALRVSVLSGIGTVCPFRRR
jgi:hypothetical protein